MSIYTTHKFVCSVRFGIDRTISSVCGAQKQRYIIDRYCRLFVEENPIPESLTVVVIVLEITCLYSNIKLYIAIHPVTV